MDTVEFTEVYTVDKDGNAWRYSSLTGEWEQIPFMPFVRVEKG